MLRHTHHHKGFTLIEILVTIVVVSIGLLGLAGLQINGLRANMSSEARSKATLLANDIIERMRANPLATASGQYANLDTADSASIDCTAQPAPFCYSASNDPLIVPSCDTTQMATYDAWIWACGMPPNGGALRGGVVNRLPNGSATVTCNANPCVAGTSHTVTVSWSELSPTDGTATIQSISLVVVP